MTLGALTLGTLTLGALTLGALTFTTFTTRESGTVAYTSICSLEKQGS